MSPSRRPRSRAIARTLPICWVIVSSDIAERNISSAWLLAKSSPAGDPPAWASTGVRCGEGSMRLNPSTLYRSPSCLMGCTLDGSA